MEKKKKRIENITKFSSYTPLAKLSKQRSPFSVWFLTEDPNDDWLIDIVRFKTKTGEIVEDTMIIKPDLETFLEVWKKDGFVEDISLTIP